MEGKWGCAVPFLEILSSLGLMSPQYPDLEDCVASELGLMEPS